MRRTASAMRSNKLVAVDGEITVVGGSGVKQLLQLHERGRVRLREHLRRLDRAGEANGGRE